MNLSSSGSGTFSQSTIDIGGGGGSPTFTYTPMAAGNHTLTAQISDKEGKSKAVTVVATGVLPSLNFALSSIRYHSETGRPLDIEQSDIFLHKNDYPAGSTFTIQCGMWLRKGADPNVLEATVTVIDRWGQSRTDTYTQEYNSGIGGGGDGGNEKPPITDR